MFRYELSKKKFLKSFTGLVRNLDTENCILIQKTLTGQEYGMDVINNLNANMRRSY